MSLEATLDLAWIVFVIAAGVALFLVGMRVLFSMARRHAAEVPNAHTKVAVALVFSLVLAGIGTYALVDFQHRGEQGIHNTFVAALNRTIGEGSWLDNTKTAKSAPVTLAKLSDKLVTQKSEYDAAVAGGDAKAIEAAKKARDETWNAINTTQATYDAAQVELKLLAPNHHVWQMVEPLVVSRNPADNEKAHDLLTKVLDPNRVTEVLPLAEACARDLKGDCKQPMVPAALKHSYFDAHAVANIPMDQGVPEAFENKERFTEQMEAQMAWLAYPDLVGFAMAPLAFVGGHILLRSFRPSDSVGFKPYPGKAAGFFLLFMGAIPLLTVVGLSMPPTLDLFGLFAIPFAAWVLRDFSKRSTEGQIAL